MTTEHKRRTSSSTDPFDSNVVGGGAINEKERTQHSMHVNQSASSDTPLSSVYDPSHTHAHLLHSIDGLHRYPNYLSRWSDDDAVALEQALLEQVQIVRQQRAANHERRTAIGDVVRQIVEQPLPLLAPNDMDDTPGLESSRELPQVRDWSKLLRAPVSWDEVRDRVLDPAASAAFLPPQRSTSRSSTWPSLSDVLQRRVDVEVDVGRLAALMDEEVPDVFSLVLLSPAFCRDVCEYVRTLAQTDPTLLGQRPVNLDLVGLSWVNDLLYALVMKPLAGHLFGPTELGNAPLDWRHGYVAGYAARPMTNTATPRERLVTHTDDSEVTLNVCLGDDFDGGLLEFRGLRGTDRPGELVGTYQPVVGKAVIHAGRHFHNVTTVTRGERYAYIVWARSWRGIRSQTCPCCWLNRRRQQSSSSRGTRSNHHASLSAPCTCGAQWN